MARASILNPSADSTITQHIMRRSDLIPIVAKAEIGADTEIGTEEAAKLDEEVEAVVSSVVPVRGELDTLFLSSM